MVNVCTPGWVVIPPLADSESRSSLVAMRNINNKDVPLAIGVYTETMFLNRGKWVGGGRSRASIVHCVSCLHVHSVWIKGDVNREYDSGL